MTKVSSKHRWMVFEQYWVLILISFMVQQLVPQLRSLDIQK